MKNILKRGLSLVLTLIMVIGMLPVTVFAAVDSSGKPTDLNNTLVVSIYTPDGSFPGEPAMHGSEDYISFNSQFAKTTASGKFKDNATTNIASNIELVECSSVNCKIHILSKDFVSRKNYDIQELQNQKRA